MADEFNLKDAAELTNSSSRETSENWHKARDDSGVREGRDEEELKQAPDWAPYATEGGIPLFPYGKGPEGN
jgi:hypothetical protein